MEEDRATQCTGPARTRELRLHESESSGGAASLLHGGPGPVKEGVQLRPEGVLRSVSRGLHPGAALREPGAPPDTPQRLTPTENHGGSGETKPREAGN